MPFAYACVHAPPACLLPAACAASGAATIKYGSLAMSLPFEASDAVAAGIVLGTPAAYGAYLLVQSARDAAK